LTPIIVTPIIGAEKRFRPCQMFHYTQSDNIAVSMIGTARHASSFVTAKVAPARSPVASKMAAGVLSR
jgi:hypothetical protein